MIDYSLFDAAHKAAEADWRREKAKKDREQPGWDKEFMSEFTFKEQVMKKHKAAMDAGRRRMYETSPGGTYDSFIEYNNPFRGNAVISGEKMASDQSNFLRAIHRGNSTQQIRDMGYTGNVPAGYENHEGNKGGYGGSKYRTPTARGDEYYNTLAKDIDMPKENRISRNIKKMQKEDPSLFKPSGTMYNLPTPGTPSYGRPGTYDPATSIFTPTDGYGTGGFLSEAQKQARDPKPDYVKNQTIAHRNKNIGGPNIAYEQDLARYFGPIKSGRMRSDSDFMDLPTQWYGQPGSENWYPNPPGWNEGITPDITILGDGTESRTQAPGASAASIKSAISANDRATLYRLEKPSPSPSESQPSPGLITSGAKATAVDPTSQAPAPGDADAGAVVAPIRVAGSSTSRTSAQPSGSKGARGYLTRGTDSTRKYYASRFG